MKDKDSKLLSEAYNQINEQYQLGKDYEPWTGNYEMDLMFYDDYQPGRMKSWIEQKIPIETKFIAFADDLREMGFKVDPKYKVYTFNVFTDFTHAALVKKNLTKGKWY